MSPLLRSAALWILSVLLLATTSGSFAFVISSSRAPLSSPVELGGDPDFVPATPAGLEDDDVRSVARIAFVGDIMQHPEQREDDFSRTYQEIRPHLLHYDLVIGNLEFPVDPTRHTGPFPGEARFNGSQEHVRALAQAGIGLVTTANNHSFDMGKEGVLSTLQVLRAEGIESFGTGHPTEDLGPKVMDLGSVRLGFVTYTFPPNVFFDEEGRPVSWPREWPINELYFDDWSGPYREEGLRMFDRDVMAAREAGAHFIIAFVHWGQEWRFAPNRHQRLAARDMVSSGIDLVVGSHSHVLNPAEWVDGHLVAYSLGNFVSAFRQLEVRTSAVLEVTLVKGDDGKTSLGDFAFRPILTAGEDHRVLPLIDVSTREGRTALKLARTILGEPAVLPFPSFPERSSETLSRTGAPAMSAGPGPR
jgi:poly-gamma-glutamate capsule biosynthesis protein CapA/YwtB (metallophosphatase superfamily)